jgi:DNA invertase Pin-like site-specific DNA recombinase
MPERKCRAAVYARVSTAAQDLDPQLAQLRRFVEAADWQLFREYSDTASGADKHRPGMQALMHDAFERRFDVLVVWKFDRFGRSVTHLVQSLEELQRLNIGFVSITERFDTSTPIGKALLTMAAAFAEMELSLNRERSEIGIALARKRGVVFGRPRRALDEEKIRGDYKVLKSLRKTAKLHRCGHSHILRILKGGRSEKKVHSTEFQS